MTGICTFVSNPSGALVYTGASANPINTGSEYPGNAVFGSAGTYAYTATLSGYPSKTGNFTLVDGVYTTVVTINFDTSGGTACNNFTVSLISSPPGANFKRRRRKNGGAWLTSPSSDALGWISYTADKVTPYTTTLDHTTYLSSDYVEWQFQFSKDGYSTVESNIVTWYGSWRTSAPNTIPMVTASGTLTLTVTTGSIVCTSSPNSTVYYGGVNKGSTPVTLTNVPAGSADVVFKLSGYTDCYKTVTVPAGGSVTATCNLSSTTGSVTFTSVPSGASIYFDGVTIGQVTPYTINNITPGTHQFLYKKSGYTDCNNSVLVQGNQTVSAYCELYSRPTTGSITCSTTPGGASIYLDGVNTGLITTNTLTSVAAGSHIITYKLLGYGDCSKTVTVPAGGSVDASCTLSATMGSLWFTTSNTASVYLDGTYVGTTPPQFAIQYVAAGDHTVVFKASGYKDCTVSVNVPAGGSATATCQMEIIPITGSIACSTTPAPASIYLNGTYSGTTPLTLTSLSTNTYTIVFRASGYNDCTVYATVVAGQTVTASCNLIASTCSWTINASPVGSSIYIDNSLEGYTSVTVPGLSIGSHALRVEYPGYTTHSASYTLVAGSNTTPITLSPVPPTTGSIYCNPSQTGSSVYLDNVFQSGTTPLTLTGISAGVTRTVRFTKIGYNDCSVQVTVPAGGQVTATCTMNPGCTPGSFTCTGSCLTTKHTINADCATYTDTANSSDCGYICNPAGASICEGYTSKKCSACGKSWDIVEQNSFGCGYKSTWTINVVPVGATVSVDGNNRTTNSSGSVTLTELVVGSSHTLTVTYPGYNQYSQSHVMALGLNTTPVTLLPTSPTEGSISVNSTPSNASFTITSGSNIVGQGSTNTIINHILPGTYSYSISLSNYVTAQGVVIVIAGITSTIDVTLNPCKGSVRFTVPSPFAAATATLFFDENSKGNSYPIEISNLSLGTHSYKFSLVGYYDFIGSINVTCGPIQIVSGVTLIKLPDAQICAANTFRCEPNNFSQRQKCNYEGTAWVNDTTSPDPTCCGAIDTNPKSIVPCNEGCIVGTGTKRVLNTCKTSCDIISDPSCNPVTTGSAYISTIYTDGSDIGGANVYIDNESRVTPIRSTPCVINNLSVGKHTLYISLYGFVDDSSEFTIVSGEITNVVVKLKEVGTRSVRITVTPSLPIQCMCDDDGKMCSVVGQNCSCLDSCSNYWTGEYASKTNSDIMGWFDIVNGSGNIDLYPGTYDINIIDYDQHYYDGKTQTITVRESDSGTKTYPFNMSDMGNDCSDMCKENGGTSVIPPTPTYVNSPDDDSSGKVSLLTPNIWWGVAAVGALGLGILLSRK